jgi:hypothetical protein
MATDLTVANTILRQLGGGRFRVMTGAYNFVGDANRLMFMLKRGTTKDAICKVIITLEPSDTYTMEFWSGFKIITMKLHKRVEDVYNDQLQEIFTRETGLYTHL